MMYHFFWLWDSLGVFLCIVLSFMSLCYDLRDGGMPHTSTCAYICRMTCESRSSISFLEVLIIGVGMGVCMPTGTCHGMSMGRIGWHMEGASISQLDVYGARG